MAHIAKNRNRYPNPRNNVKDEDQDRHNPEKNAKKQAFIIKNLQSQRKFILFQIMAVLIELLYFYYNFTDFEDWQICLTLVLSYPFA